MPEGVTTVDLTYGGPGRPPQPWAVHGSGISYDGALMLPFAVPGGNMGPGTINAMALYVKGVQFVNPVGNFLPLTGGTLTGALSLLNIGNLLIPGGSAGQMLVTDGSSNLSWSSAPPGGPYLPLTGGALSGPLQITGPSNLVIGGGTPGQLLSTNGAGVLSWTTVTSGGGAAVSIGDTPPVGPTTGNLWYDSVGGQLYIWYHDADSSQWVVTNNPQNPAQVFVSDTAPNSPNPGNFWFDSTAAQLYIYYQDATSSQWVIANSALGNYLPLSGGTLTGALQLSADPVTALQPTTKQYVDALPSAINSNRIINGDMSVDQRNNGAVVNNVAPYAYSIDRWRASGAASNIFSYGRNQGSGPIAPNFPFYLGATALSTFTVGTGDYYYFGQIIESSMISDFQWGTVNALPITLSFWVTASVAGTYGGSVQNIGNTRSYPFSFQATTSWTLVSITVPGDTTGTWVMNGTNVSSLLLIFDLGAGAPLRSTAFSWQSGNFVGVTGAQSIAFTAGRTFRITGVKLETGLVATPFNRKTTKEILSDCQRYYQTITSWLIGGYAPAASAIFYSDTMLATTMRAAPTAAFVGANYSNASGLTVNNSFADSIAVRMTGTAVGGCWGQATITMIAEL